MSLKLKSTKINSQLKRDLQLRSQWRPVAFKLKGPQNYNYTLKRLFYLLICKFIYAREREKSHTRQGDSGDYLAKRATVQNQEKLRDILTSRLKEGFSFLINSSTLWNVHALINNRNVRVCEVESSFARKLSRKFTLKDWLKKQMLRKVFAVR